MSLLSSEIFERRDRIRAWFESLQARICAELERLEDEALAELYPEPPSRFEIRPWVSAAAPAGS